VDATLSGVPVILTVVIGGVTYHWKAYPTKA